MFAEVARAVPGQQADAHPAGVVGRQRAHHDGHLRVARLVQRVRDQVHAALRPEVSSFWMNQSGSHSDGLKSAFFCDCLQRSVAGTSHLIQKRNTKENSFNSVNFELSGQINT